MTTGLLATLASITTQRPASRMKPVFWSWMSQLPVRTSELVLLNATWRPVGWASINAFGVVENSRISGYLLAAITILATALGQTVEASRAAVYRLRKRFREVLRDAVADTLEEPTDHAVDEELQALRSALSV